MLQAFELICFGLVVTGLVIMFIVGGFEHE